MMHPLSLIVHGGARPIPPEKAAANREGCVRALEVGWKLLGEGRPAVEVVEAAIRILEEDPTFNAGYGATLNPDGVVRLDSGLMEGKNLNAGAVACVEGLRHPVSVARQLLERPEVLVVAEYAQRLALATGDRAGLCAPESLITEEQRQKWEEHQGQGPPSNDTVGAVACDQYGTLAAGTSTGGTGDKTPGRVGDSPSVGAGFFADNTLGACALTGEGEGILRLALGRVGLEVLRQSGNPDGAAQRAMELLEERTGAKAGIILIAPDGRIGWAHNEENMAVAYRTTAMTAPAVFLHKREEVE